MQPTVVLRLPRILVPRVIHLLRTIKLEGTDHYKNEGDDVGEKKIHSWKFKVKKKFVHTAGKGRKKYLQAKKKEKHGHKAIQKKNTYPCPITFVMVRP